MFLWWYRNLAQYFGLFVMYMCLGIKEKTQLLNLSVPVIFIQVSACKILKCSINKYEKKNIEAQKVSCGHLLKFVENLKIAHKEEKLKLNELHLY